MEGSNISACNSSSLIPPTSAFSLSRNNCLVDCSDLQWRRKCCRVSPEALQSGLVYPVTNNLINLTITTSTFPNSAKRAQVSPLLKKDDAMIKSNFRPASLLPIPSKNFEKVLANQLSEYFESIFDDFLCAFRKGHWCQTTILRLLEDWKYALDNNEYVAAIIMDLLKAFDCLPHNILLCKLSSWVN